MSNATYQLLLDTARTQFDDDLIARGLAAQDQQAAYDLTGRLMEATIRRGRRRELSTFEPGTLSLLLRNDDDELTPDRSATLGGYLNPGAKIVLRAVTPDYTNLVSWWDLDEPTGATRRDAHGTNHLNVLSAATQTTGKVGHALQTYGGGSVGIASNAILQPGNFDFSLCGWFSISSLATDASLIIKGSFTFGSDAQFQLWYDASAQSFKFRVSGNGLTGLGNDITSVTASTFGTPSVDTFYFLYVFHDAASDLIGISVNGGAIDTAAFANGVYASGTSNLVVCISGIGTYCRGDALVYYKRLLHTSVSTAELSTLYNGGNGWAYVARAQGGYRNLFTGYVEDIVPQLDDNNQTVTITANDLLERLDNVTVTSGLHQSKTTGELIRRILSDSLSVRIDQTDIDDGQDTVTYAWWTAENALEALRGVETSEWGQFFVDGRGFPTFTDRTARGVVAATGGRVIGSSEIVGADAQRSIRDVFNEVRVFAHPRLTPRTKVQIWNLRQTLTLLAGQSQAIIAQYSDPETQENVPALNVITPAATVDYSANTTVNGGQVTSIAMTNAGTGYDINNPPRVSFSGGGGYGAEAVAEVSTTGTVALTIVSGGGGYTSNPTIGIDPSPTGGTNATASATVTVGTDKTSLLSVTAQFADFGSEARIVLKNTDASTIYVPYLRLRGDPLMEPDTSPAIASDGTSIDFYQRRVQDIDQPWQQSTTLAETLATTLLNRHKDPRTTIRIRLANLSQYELCTLLGMELDKGLDVTLERAGLSATFFVGGLEHTIGDGGLIHTLVLDLERSRVEGVGLYDSGIYDTTKFA